MNSNTSASIRHKLYDYIRFAGDKKLSAIYSLLEGEIKESKEWWKDKGLVEELDRRHEELESGTDKGYSTEQLQVSIGKLRKKR